MQDEKKIYEHPSFGLITSSRQSSSKNMTMFGSSLKTNHNISIEIQPAELHRDLNHDWFHGKRRPIIRIEMTEGQWASFVSSMNVGDGTPCTLKYVDGEQIENPPFLNKVVEFQEEFQERMKGLSNDLKKLVTDTVEMLTTKKNINKSDRALMLSSLQSVVQTIENNLPFMAESFGNQMEKTIDEAKLQISSYYNSVVVQSGLNQLEEAKRMTAPQIAEGSNEEK